MRTSIKILIPYFGKWPGWFDYFLLSCRYNPSVSWQFYTDCTVPESAPDNVKFTQMSFADYKAFVSARLGIAFDPDSPYKLCDIKQALPFIHQEDALGYDFVGFSDIDLVYGDLRKYFTEEKFKRFDFFSTHANRVSGHFCLMRNNEKMINAFRKIKHWQKRFEAQEHFALDEGAFSKIFIKRKNFPKPLFNLVSFLNPWRRRSEFVEAYTTPNAGVAWIDGSFSFPAQWCWNEGKLTNNLTGNREYPYFHFFGWKKAGWDEHAFKSKDAARDLKFIITEEGFSHN